MSELWLRICSNTHEKVESEQAVRMRTLIFTTALARTGISVYWELNQAHYDKAITDKHIRNLARETGQISREALIETGGPSAVTLRPPRS
ncbi:MAG: hypothetical protein ACRD8W_17885 [Nitrososphaeraceae archaeon]